MKFLILLLIVPAFSLAQPKNLQVLDLVMNQYRFHDEKTAVLGMWRTFNPYVLAPSNAKPNLRAKYYSFSSNVIDSLNRAKDTAIMRLQFQVDSLKRDRERLTKQIDSLGRTWSYIPFDTTHLQVVNGLLTTKPPKVMTLTERDRITTWKDGDISINTAGTVSMMVAGRWKIISAR